MNFLRKRRKISAIFFFFFTIPILYLFLFLSFRFSKNRKYTVIIKIRYLFISLTVMMRMNIIMKEIFSSLIFIQQPTWFELNWIRFFFYFNSKEFIWLKKTNFFLNGEKDEMRIFRGVFINVKSWLMSNCTQKKMNQKISS